MTEKTISQQTHNTNFFKNSPRSHSIKPQDKRNGLDYSFQTERNTIQAKPYTFKNQLKSL